MIVLEIIGTAVKTIANIISLHFASCVTPIKNLTENKRKGKGEK